MSIGSDRYFKWDYDETADILNIHKKGKFVSGSAEFEDFTVDFDKNDNVVGVEIDNASEFFGQVGIRKEQLANIGMSELTTQLRANYLLVWVKISVPKKVPVKTAADTPMFELRVPLPTPVLV